MIEKTPNPARLSRFWSLWELFLLGFGVIAFIFGGLALIYWWFDIPLGLEGELPVMTTTFSLAIVFVNALAFGLPVGIVLLLRKGKDTADGSFGFGWRWPDQPWLLASAALGAAAIFVTNLIAFLVFALQGIEEPVNPQLDLVVPDGFSWVGAIGMTIGVGILVPIAEEMLFRGVIHRALRQLLSFWPAVVISSLVFGALHGQLAIAAGAAVLGGVNAWVYERSCSIWPPILIHVINNAVKVVVLYAALALGLTEF